jgi:2-haloalkanoic acid dehalogenase type II
MRRSILSTADRRIKAVFTDSKNTLFAWDPIWVEACAAILQKYGSDMQPREFWRLWAMASTGENHRAAFGKWRTFTETLQAALMIACKFAGIPGEPDDVRFMTDRWGDVLPYPDVAPALSRVQQTVPVLIYSNVETEYLDAMVEKLGDFRPAFVGDMDKSHSRKPSPRAYRWVLEAVGRELGLELDFEDVLYVAGPQWDVQGAMALGMKGVWIHRSFRFPAEVEGVEPDYQIDTMDEVIDILESEEAGR